MHPYQNFSYQQPPMNPYQNFNQPVPMHTYTDRMDQLQQYQQNLQQPNQVQGSNQQQQGIIGRVVSDFNEITANDVPMNGSAAFFPKADGSELQVRSWSSNGTIQTVVYRPVMPENAEHGTNAPQTDFNSLNSDLKALRDEISERFDKLEKSMRGSASKSTASKVKKEVTVDE